MLQNFQAGDGPARWVAALRRLRAAPDDAAARALFSADVVLRWEPGEADLPKDEIAFLLRWWRKLASEHGGLPPASLPLDPLALRPALGYLMTLDVLPEAADFRYRLFGSRVAERSGFDLTGKLVSKVPGPPDGVAWFLATYAAAALERAPLYAEHTPWSSMSVTRWYRLILPLAGPDGSVARFIVGNVPGSLRTPSTELLAELAVALPRRGR